MSLFSLTSISLLLLLRVSKFSSLFCSLPLWILHICPSQIFILFFPCATLLVLLEGSRATLLQHTCLESSRLVNVPVLAALSQLWDIWSLCFDASNVRYILYDSQSHCATNSGNFVVLCGKYDCSHWYTHKSRFRSVFERSSSLYRYPQTRIMITTSVIIGGYLSELFLQFQ